MDFKNSDFINPTHVGETPERTGDINKILITEKLEQLGIDLSAVSLGDFDAIGELTAKKIRDRNSELYKTVGAYFRPNYERGILIYSIIKKFKLESFLEIGYGRGFACYCAAMAFSELGKGKVITVDPALNEEAIRELSNVLPTQWFDHIEFNKTTSDLFFSDNNDKFDFIYIDGDHRYEFVKRDWENTKDRYNNFLLFDDYHLPSKVQKDINVSNLVDSISDPSKEMIIMDRRIFFDDRRIPDSEIDYGQVLLTR